MGESFAQSRQQLVARDFHLGKQRVSRFHHVSQLLYEKNVFRSPENGTLFLHLARDLRHGKQRDSPFYHGSDTTIRSHKSRARIPSNLNPASKEMISDSVELCETEVCFLHIQIVGTNV